MASRSTRPARSAGASPAAQPEPPEPTPAKYGVTHWSARLLGRHLGIGDATVAAIRREAGIQPWRAARFRFSTDPELVGKVTDVVGLHLAPPRHRRPEAAARRQEFLAFLRQVARGYPRRELHPVTWTETAHDILTTADRQTTSDARH